MQKYISKYSKGWRVGPVTNSTDLQGMCVYQYDGSSPPAFELYKGSGFSQCAGDTSYLHPFFLNHEGSRLFSLAHCITQHSFNIATFDLQLPPTFHLQLDEWDIPNDQQIWNTQKSESKKTRIDSNKVHGTVYSFLVTSDKRYLIFSQRYWDDEIYGYHSAVLMRVVLYDLKNDEVISHHTIPMDTSEFMYSRIFFLSNGYIAHICSKENPKENNFLMGSKIHIIKFPELLAQKSNEFPLSNSTEKEPTVANEISPLIIGLGIGLFCFLISLYFTLVPLALSFSTAIAIAAGCFVGGFIASYISASLLLGNSCCSSQPDDIPSSKSPLSLEENNSVVTYGKYFKAKEFAPENTTTQTITKTLSVTSE